jgi:hypothetical protein
MNPAADEEAIKIRTISNANGILNIATAWNKLVSQSCGNPFLLSEFVKQFTESNQAKGWNPLIQIFSMEKDIVGIAPIMTRRTFGIRSAKFIVGLGYSPDFIFCDKCREVCTSQILAFLFNTLKCKFVDIVLPRNSPNWEILLQQCKEKRINFKITPRMGHRTLLSKSTWAEYEAHRGRNFRNKFRKMERKLRQAGSWKIVCSKGTEKLEMTNEILNIERRSWKEEWRRQRGKKIDEELLLILRASQNLTRIEPDFQWNIWFLELNKVRIAYLLVLHYGKVAYITKGSYAEQFKSFYPGIYLRNYVIHKLFDSEEIERIDFLTSLSFHQTWTAICEARAVVSLTKSIFPKISRFIFERMDFSKIRKSRIFAILSSN